MKIAVVGAGIGIWRHNHSLWIDHLSKIKISAGVCATKHCLDYGYNVTTFEKTNTIGGTWVYTDNVEKDEFGMDVHTSMYQNLKWEQIVFIMQRITT